MRQLGDCCKSTEARKQIGFNDFLTFMLNAKHKSGKEIFWMRKPSKFNVPESNERTKELNARYREAESHWNIVGRPRSDPLAELKCRALASFWHEMKFFRENKDQLRSPQCYQNFKGENAMISGRKLKHSIIRRNSCH